MIGGGRRPHRGAKVARVETETLAVAEVARRIEPHKDRHGEYWPVVAYASSQKTFEDVACNLIWTPRGFLDEIDKYRVRARRAAPARRRGARPRMRDSTRAQASARTFATSTPAGPAEPPLRGRRRRPASTASKLEREERAAEMGEDKYFNERERERERESERE